LLDFLCELYYDARIHEYQVGVVVGPSVLSKLGLRRSA